MENVSPNIFVNDLPGTVAFYQKLGFELVTSVPGDDGEMLFALLVNGAATFMFQTFKSINGLLPQVSRSNGGSLLLYVKMKGIRAFFEQLSGDVPLLSGLETTFYGATEFSLLDPNNFVLTFAEDE